MESRSSDSRTETGAERPGAARRRRLLGLALRAAASLAILAALLGGRAVEWDAVREALARSQPALVAGSFLGFLLLMLVKSWRWQLLVRRAGGRLGLPACFRSYLAGFALGVVTPGRLGELSRVADLRRRTGMALGPALRSVAADRLADLVFLAAFGGAALVQILRFTRGWLWLPLFAAAAAVLTAGLGTLGRLLSRLLPRRLRGAAAGELLERAPAEVSGRRGVAVLLVTVLAYLVYFAASYLLFLAVGVEVAVVESALVLGGLSLVLLVPVSVAGFGPREATLVLLLARYGVPQEEALALSLVHFAVFFLLGGIAGAACWIPAAGPLRRSARPGGEDAALRTDCTNPADGGTP